MSRDSSPNYSKKSKYSKNDLMHMSRKDLVSRFLNIQTNNDLFFDKIHLLNKELIQEKETNMKLRAQGEEWNQRESFMKMKISIKEQEVHELMSQIQEYKQLHSQTTSQLHNFLLDPSINLIFQNMIKQLETFKSKLKLAEENNNAVKFTPDSEIGKRLVAKCGQLLQENDEIGKMISTGSVAKLESMVAMEKQKVLSCRLNELEYEKYLEESEVEKEGLQSVVLDQLEKLKRSGRQVEEFERENLSLKNRISELEKEQQTIKKEVGRVEENRRSGGSVGKSGDLSHNKSHVNPLHCNSNTSNNINDNSNININNIDVTKSISNTNSNINIINKNIPISSNSNINVGGGVGKREGDIQNTKRDFSSLNIEKNKFKNSSSNHQVNHKNDEIVKDKLKHHHDERKNSKKYSETEKMDERIKSRKDSKYDDSDKYRKRTYEDVEGSSKDRKFRKTNDEKEKSTKSNSNSQLSNGSRSNKLK